MHNFLPFAKVIGSQESQRPEGDTLQGNHILFSCWYRFKGWMSQALWILRLALPVECLWVPGIP